MGNNTLHSSDGGSGHTVAPGNVARRLVSYAINESDADPRSCAQILLGATGRARDHNLHTLVAASKGSHRDFAVLPKQ